MYPYLYLRFSDSNKMQLYTLLLLHPSTLFKTQNLITILRKMKPVLMQNSNTSCIADELFTQYSYGPLLPAIDKVIVNRALPSIIHIKSSVGAVPDNVLLFYQSRSSDVIHFVTSVCPSLLILFPKLLVNSA